MFSRHLTWVLTPVGTMDGGPVVVWAQFVHHLMMVYRPGITSTGFMDWGRGVLQGDWQGLKC